METLSIGSGLLSRKRNPGYYRLNDPSSNDREELACHVGGIHLRIDSIEQAIRDSGVVSKSLGYVGYRVSYSCRQQETPEQGGNNPPQRLPLLADRVYAPGTPLTGSPLFRL